MKVTSYVESNYLNADDVPTPTLLTVKDVQEEKVGKDDKLVMYAEEFDKVIPLGKTTLLQLCEIFGSDDTDDWAGQRVVVFNDKQVMFSGRKVGGLRFRAPRGEHANPPRDVNANSQRKAAEIPDDNIPF